MGSRALVAYERDGGRFDLHYSHWGAAGLRLAGDLSPETPFGRRADSSSGGDGDPPVSREPLETGLSREAVFDRADLVLHEALYLVSPTFEVATYLPLSFVLDPTCPADDDGSGDVEVDDAELGDAEADDTGPRNEPTAGILVRVEPCDPVDAPTVRAWLRGARETLAALAERGVVAERTAREVLLERAREEFVGREVVVR